MVCELLKNSLDASSKKIDISVDYSRGSCVLEDDGLGILPSEFGDEGGLGKLYRENIFPHQDHLLTYEDSSKSSTSNPVHGGRGTFLASLSAMSLLSITSRHHQHYSHNTLTMHKSAVVSRQTPSLPQLHLTSFNRGTRVTVRDLFGNMPVRVKQRAASSEKPRGNSREWEELKRDVVLLLLAWPSSVAVTIRETATNEKMQIRGYTSAATSTSCDHSDLSVICGTLAQASLISFEDKSYWISTRAFTPSLVINAAISLLPSVTKHIQFISFGIQPLVTHDTRSILHDEINRMFLNSSFGNDEAAVDVDAAEIDRRAKDKRYKGDGFTNRELKGGKKGIDRWPMFYINIRQSLASTDGQNFDIDKVLDDQGSNLNAIIELLQAMIWEFLIKYHFRPKHSRGYRAKPTVNAGDDNAVDLKLSGQSTSSHSKDKVVSTKRKEAVASPQMKGSMQFGRPLFTPNTPFDVWTRVKVGSKPMKFLNLDQVQRTTNVENITRPSSAPPSSGSRKFALTANAINRSTTPLVSSKGKIVRRPFEEVAISPARPRTTVAKAGQQALELPANPDNDVIDQGEEVIAWTNPITKAKSLVNQRTGLTICFDKTNSSDPENASLSTTRTNLNRVQVAKSTSLPKEEPSPWLKDILKSWNNPVFCLVEPSIPQATFDGLEAGAQELLQGRRHHCTQIDIDRAFKQSSARMDGRISKTALREAEVISQVDSKFILVKLKLAISEAISDLGSNNLLVLIDQHAADERIRIEALWQDLFALAADTPIPTVSGVRTSLLGKPIHFEVSIKESGLLSKYKEYFAYWGIIFDLPSNSQPKSTLKSGAMQNLTVRSLPPSIIERCKLDPRLLISLIRTEAWKIHDSGASLRTTDGDWLQRIHNCPQGIIDMLNSRACRSAIMFNDELSIEQCQILVSRLAKCKFPFQCAHGRPSLVPLVDVGRVDMRAGIQEGDETFGAAFNKWKGKMK